MEHDPYLMPLTQKALCHIIRYSREEQHRLKTDMGRIDQLAEEALCAKGATITAVTVQAQGADAHDQFMQKIKEKDIERQELAKDCNHRIWVMRKIGNALRLLTEQQKRLLYSFAVLDISVREFAKLEAISENAAYKRRATVYDKMLRYINS